MAQIANLVAFIFTERPAVVKSMKSGRAYWWNWCTLCISCFTFNDAVSGSTGFDTILARAKCGIQTHDDVFSTRNTFHHFTKSAMHVEGSLSTSGRTLLQTLNKRRWELGIIHRVWENAFEHCDSFKVSRVQACSLFDESLLGLGLTFL